MSNPVVDTIIKIVYKGLEHFGRYYSEYQGFCYDNLDPEGMGRLQMVVPGIIDNPTDEWYFGSGVFSGNNYGCQILPQKGDVIMVWFEMGDPNKPRWRLGYFAEGEIPPERIDPNIYWFRTPKGILVELDDTKGQVRISDTLNNKIQISTTGVSIKSKKIFLGDIETNTHSAVLGEELTSLLSDIIDVMSEITVISNGTLSSVPANSLEISSLKIRAKSILSNINKLN